MTKEKKLGIIVAVVIVAVLVLSSLQLRQHTCEVYITFGGADELRHRLGDDAQGGAGQRHQYRLRLDQWRCDTEHPVRQHNPRQGGMAGLI